MDLVTSGAEQLEMTGAATGAEYEEISGEPWLVQVFTMDLERTGAAEQLEMSGAEQADTTGAAAAQELTTGAAEQEATAGALRMPALTQAKAAVRTMI